MRKEIRRIDPERGICQITTLDERFYSRVAQDPSTGLDCGVEFRPSVTWICDHYPKGRGFEHWLKRNGDEADQIARLAADRGYAVHRAVALLNEGETVRINDTFETQDGDHAELTPDEYAAVISYVDWWKAEGEEKYERIAWEYTIWPDAEACAEKYGLPAECFRFAGTVDLKVRRKADDTLGIVDMKTSRDIYPAHEIQVSAYAKAECVDWRAILQLNYVRTKTRKWKFTEIPDQFRLFLSTMQIWAHETEGIEPLQRDFPLALQL